MRSNSILSLVDTHCHLNLEDFDDDRTQVIERARENGIKRILIPGIDLATSKSALKYSQEYPEIFVAVGVHPNNGLTWEQGCLSELKILADEEKVVAIGEIGLDYYRNFTPRETQRAIFLQQLELAAELDLPVIIHNRDASKDIVEILRTWHDGLVGIGARLADHPGVLHSFSADMDIARSVIGMNFKIGVTGPVTFRNGLMLQNVVSSVKLENLLVETDAPYLAPHPYRGKRNEPANVRIIAEKIAELKKYHIDMVANITTEAADQLFDWSVIH